MIEILELLTDGKWHGVEEIRWKMQLKEHEVHKIVTFFEEYNFILLEKTRGAIKIEETARRFLIQSASS
jgi:hypothetical protein